MRMKRLNKNSSEKNNLPLLIVSDSVYFPYTAKSVTINRDDQIKAIETAMETNRSLFVTTARNFTDVNLDEKDSKIIAFETDKIFTTMTRSRILQVLKSPDGTLRVLIEGQKRAKLVKAVFKNEIPFAIGEIFPDKTEVTKAEAEYMNLLKSLYEEYLIAQKTVPREIVEMVKKAEFPDKMVDLICSNVRFTIEDKLEILAEENSLVRLEKTANFIQTDMELIQLRKKIKFRVKESMEKKQKEYFLNEQIREINKELGRTKEDSDEFAEYEEKIKAKNMPAEIEEKARKELSKLMRLQAVSPESGILKFYLDWILDLPWSERRQENKDIKKASEILDTDHYDLEKPKERILDFIAVRQLTQHAKGPILCFVGPPGTGKTSLGKSVAKAIGRDFVRISLGGVRDESEIRGHRRTYIGALPGKIIQSMKKAGTMNPVFLLDEIDKMSSDFRGDPSSAMLEVLDPEQNYNFSDHYLEVPYNLSEVMFIATANNAQKIPGPLRDRMEIIEIPGYSNFDKIKIAKKFIIPKQILENGLPEGSITFKEDAISEIIEGYTMESGVRNLERKIATVIRKCARQALEENLENLENDSEDEDKIINLDELKKSITKSSIEKYLGPKKITRELLYPDPKVGLVNGLAWTELGGTILPIEATTYPGSGKLILTGSLGDVMKESAQTALSFIRSVAKELNLDPDMHKEIDIHIHVPEGAIPKDGPSAGITMATALISIFKKQPTIDSIAMTGELTLTGRILPIGGVKEKILAAYIHNIKTVFIPEANRKDLEEVPKEVRNKIKFIYMNSALDALVKIFPEGTFNDGAKNG
ncbi:MAG: endopeptidase La [Spirochaetales bacterium]|nr:endopeptidase La [Spirochaetales bacterium]